MVHLRRTGRSVSLAAVVGLVLALLVVPTAPAGAVVPAQPGAFVSVPPSRLLDTRVNGPKAGPGQTRSLTVIGVGGVAPTGVSAVVLNVTVTNTTSDGYLTVSPTGTARAVVSNLNWSAGATTPNAVTVKVGSGGQVDLYQSGPGSADLVVDVAGYYLAGTVSAAGGFTPVPPARLLDTRSPGQQNPAGAVTASQTRDLKVLGTASVPATGVSAVILNVTVTDTTASGYLTVFPTGTPKPQTSNLNWKAGVTVPHLVVAKVGDNGRVSFYQSGPGAASLVVDMAGFFLDGTPTEAGMYVAIPPSRLLDTRTTLGTVSAGQDRQLQVVGRGGVPAFGVGAVVVNGTVDQTTSPGYLTMHPGPEKTPLASNVNWSGPNSTVGNLVTVPLNIGGAVTLHNGSQGSAQFIVDIFGYYLAPPNPNPTGGPAATRVSSGGQHTCAANTVGALKCWGNNGAGQLGDGTTTDRWTPVDVAGLGSGITAIAAGVTHTCALTSDGAVKCWGRNYEGELGDATNTGRLTPVDVSGLSSGVTDIVAGRYHTCALTSAGAVKCWGRNEWGNLGDGTTTDRWSPVDVIGLGSGIAAIAASPTSTCALTNAGVVKCWGGVADATSPGRWTPVDVTGLGSGITAIALGWQDSCALTNAGTVKCWTYDYFGTWAGGPTVQYPPVDVTDLGSGIAAITAGFGHRCALTNAGGVKCWGSNESGQLGDGTLTSHESVVDVTGLGSGIVALSIREQESCALTSAGAVKCWGDNRTGQLGDNTTINRMSPVDVTGFTGNP